MAEQVKIVVKEAFVDTKYGYYPVGLEAGLPADRQEWLTNGSVERAVDQSDAPGKFPNPSSHDHAAEVAASHDTPFPALLDQHGQPLQVAEQTPGGTVVDHSDNPAFTENHS